MIDRRSHDVLQQYEMKPSLPKRRIERVVLEHKMIVEYGGGEYVPGMLGDLVLFNSRQTGSTLALPEKELTVEAVARRILLSNQSFGK